MKEIDIYDSLINDSKTKKISEILPSFIILAQKLGEIEMKNWAELEYNGYFSSNPVMTDNTEVPEYRTVPGIFKDYYDRPLIITDPKIEFINSIRIRHGISELEDWSMKKEELALADSSLMSVIYNHLNVKVHKFTFDSSSLKSVLSGARTKMISNLIILESHFKNFPTSKSSEIQNFDLDRLHPMIREQASKLFDDGHFRQAILDSYISLIAYVKTKSGVKDLDNTQLMQKVFSPKDPFIKVSDNIDEQLGFMWMFSGAVMGIRNPNSHRIISHDNKQKTFEWLCFASALFRIIDESERVR